jgi:hypothetical protein
MWVNCYNEEGRSLFSDDFRLQHQNDLRPDGIVAHDLDPFDDVPFDGQDSDPRCYPPFLPLSETARTGHRGGTSSRKGGDLADDQLFPPRIGEFEGVLQLLPLTDRAEIMALGKEDDRRLGQDRNGDQERE